MARIPEAELERLKRETDLVALVTAAGVQLRRHGANLVGRCPFHDDQGPSLVVTPGKHLWHCLGACQAGGSVIDWVMRRERVSFRHAVELLRGSTAGSPRSGVAQASSSPALSPIAAASADDAALVRAVIDHYHETLKESEEAVAYLERRGLNSVELIDRFRLGYANRTLGYRLPKKVLKAGAEVRGRLQRVGLLRESGHEHFSGSLVVPIVGERGQVVQCYGRKLRDDLREGTPVHLYLPGPHTAVWNVEALASSKEIILCEALLDAMSFWVAGLRNVTTSYGVSGFTEAHRAAFRLHGTERVLIAYDADEAGHRAAERGAEELTRMGIDCYRIHFPRGLDANAYAVGHAPASESLAALVRGATWMGRGTPVVPVPALDATSQPSSLAAASRESAAPTSEPAAPAASPVPSRPASALMLEARGDELYASTADRTYRVRGLAKNTSPDALRVNLLVRRGEAVHVDTLDLYAARARGLFVSHAAQELGVSDEIVKRDVGALILALEERLAQEIAAANAPPAPAAPVMGESERAAALALLRDPTLLDRILADFEAAGVVGEETNKLVGYLAAVSRKLPEPLAVIIQSASAAGKTSLMDAVLAFVPPEERVQYSAMTGQALFYMAETNLKHKVLAVVEEEGAERASYALKLLQSEGELTIASTGKDPETGKLVTHEYRVEGPVMIILTTTAVELDEELVNRALVLTVDEDREQTRAIHQRQRARRTLEGLLSSMARTEVLALHRNAQRLLEPVAVVNPYAPRLTFLDARTRTRRDHEKYLTLIDVVAFLHQHQRARKTITRYGRELTYIEATLDDIAVANRLADAVLGRSLDELPPQARKLLALLTRMVTEHAARERLEPRLVRFSRRAVRDFTGWTDFQVRVHLAKLESLEYVLAHRGARGQCYVYELLYQGEGEGAEGSERPRFLMGLLDVERLRSAAPTNAYDPDFEGSTKGLEPPAREIEHRSSPQRAPDVPRVSAAPSEAKAATPKDLARRARQVAAHASNGTHPPRRTVPPGARS